MNQLISILVVAVLAAGFSSCTSSRHISRKDWYENYDDYGRPLPDRKGRSKSGKKKGGKVKSPKIVATGTARDVIDLAYGWRPTVTAATPVTAPIARASHAMLSRTAPA